MSMSTHVVGFHPPNEIWRRMKTAWQACKNACVDPPDEVVQFFNDKEPDDSGVEIDLDEHESTSKYHTEYSAGIEVDLTKLPKNITKIRFINSY